MSIKLWIIFFTGLCMYDSYHEHYYFKRLKTYQKYYKMAGIAVFGLGLYAMINKGGHMDSASVLNNFIKVLPIDRDTKDMFTPFIPNASEHKMSTSGTSTGTKSKRSVSETKKKYVASLQNWLCGDCQKQLPAWFEVDHTTRLEHGGTNEISNLVALCRDCHGKKTSLENMS